MKRYLPNLLLILLVWGPGGTVFGQNYVFARLSGTPMNTTGWNLAGDAHVGNILGSADSELIVCRAAFMNSGAVFFGQPINLAFCNKWIAEFDFRMYDGNGADGLAFCFLDVPPSGYVNGGGLGIPNDANGLKVCFDTWNNCIPFDTSTVHFDMPKIEIRWGKGYDDSTADSLIYGECLTMPTLNNTYGELSYIRGPNYNHAKIVYDTGKITVYVNDTAYLNATVPNLNFAGYMGFTASTGGYDDNHSIKNVIIYTQMPQSYAGTPMAFCPYDTVRLGGPANPAYLYNWSPSAGLSDTTSAAPLLHLANNSSNSALQTYYVRTAFADNPGCSSVDSVTVKVYPNPEVNFTMPKICLNDAVGQFYDSTYTSDPETLPFTYKWTFGDPSASPGNPDNSSLPNPSHRYSAAANYAMSLTVTNSQGCIDSASRIFTVNGTNPQAVFDVLHPAQLCSNDSVVVADLSTVNFGSVVAIRIYWGDTAGVSYMDSLPYSGKLYSHHYPDPVSVNTASYTIRMVASSGLTCDNEADQPISVLPGPHVVFDAIPKVCDVDTAIDLTEARELAGLSGSGTFTGQGVTAGGSFDPAKAGPGTDSLLYTYVAANGCRDSAYQTVFVQSLPRVRAGDDTSVVVGQPLQLNATSSDPPGLDGFSWSPSEGLNDPSIASPVAILGPETDTIRYVATATDSLGCTGQASIKVVVFRTGPGLFVPNAFTPGLSTNRIFRPIAAGITALKFFRVYNRYGELMYSTSQLGEGWDGTLLGRPQVAGAYVWMLEGVTYAGKLIEKRGTVILVR